MKHPRQTLAALTAGLLLSGCIPSLSDLNFDFRNNGISGRGGETATAARPEADANGVITYSSYQVAVARQGDTVADVASRLGLTAQELAEFNARTSTDILRSGEILALPRRVASVGSGNITDIASAAIDAAGNPTTAPAQPGAEPIQHIVRRGETAFSVARLYNVSVRSLAEWNGLGPDLAVREGQPLMIPLAANGGTLTATPLADAGLPGDSTPPLPPSSSTPLPETVPEAEVPDLSTAARPVPAPVPAPEPTPEPTPQPQPEPEPTPAPTPEPAPAPAPAPAAESQLQRPVAGPVLRGFSSDNEGIDIAAAAGTAVRAAEAGEVAAITRDTDQIPILVIRHPGNLLTVYANIQNITVARGDQVSRGQSVAEVGPGDPSFLHFEARRGFVAVDPTSLIE